MVHVFHLADLVVAVFAIPPGDQFLSERAKLGFSCSRPEGAAGCQWSWVPVGLWDLAINAIVGLLFPESFAVLALQIAVEPLDGYLMS